MQSINMLVLAIMAMVISLKSAAALGSAPVSNTHPTGHYGSYTGSMTGKYNTMTGWGEWSGKSSVQPSLEPTAELSMTETDATTTSTIHVPTTKFVTARDNDHTSTRFVGIGPVSHAGLSTYTGTEMFTGHGTLSPTGSVSYAGTKSFTKTASGMTTTTTAASEEAAVEDGCTPVFFRGGGFCLPTAAKRGDDVMTNAHTFSHHESITDTMNPIGSVSYTGTKSFTNTASGMITVTVAAREEAAVKDECTPVFFRGGGFCLPTAAKRGDDVKMHAHKHSHHESESHSMTMAN